MPRDRSEALNTISDMMEKPMTHYTWKQWVRGNKNMEKVSDTRNYVSNEVRQTAEQMRNSTNNTVRWQLEETNNRMKDRLSEVEQWYKNLERTLEDLKDQTQRMSHAKVALESSLADLLPLKEAAEEVITIRERRREVDLAEDEPYREIHNERKLIIAVENLFRTLAQTCFTDLLELKEQRDRLAADLKRKSRTMEIDNYKLSLTPNSVGCISYKPEPLDLPFVSVNMETWLHNCTKLKKDTEYLLTRVMRQTNDAWGLLHTKLDDVKKQRELTERALRIRLLETIQTRDRLGIQRKQLMDERDKLGKEIRDMEKEIAEKIGHIKLVHTRFENRKWRPGMELCHDVTQMSLKKELDHVTKSKDLLEEHLRDVKNNFNCVCQQLHAVEDDLERKERSLALENACLESHTNPPKPPYQQPLSWRVPATSLEFTANVDPASIRRGDVVLEGRSRHSSGGGDASHPKMMDASVMARPDGDICHQCVDN